MQQQTDVMIATILICKAVAGKSRLVSLGASTAVHGMVVLGGSTWRYLTLVGCWLLYKNVGIMSVKTIDVTIQRSSKNNKLPNICSKSEEYYKEHSAHDNNGMT